MREVEHLDFVDAVERLASRAGITLRYDDKAVAKDRTKKQRLAEAVAARDRVLPRAAAPVGRRRPRAPLPARPRLRRRRGAAVPARLVARRVGPAERAPATAEVRARRHRRRRPRVREQGEQAAGPVPRPAHVPDLRLARRGGRASAGARSAPTARSTRTRPRRRSTRRAGCCTASTGRRARSSRRGEVVICEGYTDVMAFALAGAPNAVATCGTALADDHFQILKNLARKVVLAYDSDAAGQGAAEKWYGWEQQLRDPAAGRRPAGRARSRRRLARRSRSSCCRRSSGATPFLQFRLDRVLAAADLATLEGRARAAESAAAIVARAPERPRARPVRHEAGGRARHRRRPAPRDGGAPPT